MITTVTAERRASVINPLHPRDPGLAALFDLGIDSASGESVTAETSMRQEGFLSGVRYIAETIASVPLQVFETLPRGKQAVPDYPLYERLHDQPNLFQTSFEWRDMMLHHLILRGNSYNRILPDGRLIPYHPDRMRPFWAKPGVRGYEYLPLPGSPDLLEDRIILAEEMFHITFMPLDGLRGRSLIEYQRDTIGRALATNKHGSSVFRNGGRPGGVIKSKKKLSVEAKKSLRDQWTERHEGAGNAGRVAIFEEDLDWQDIGLTNADLQFMDLMKFDVESMARILRVPPHKIGAMEKATFGNIEHQAIEAVQDTIGPWCVRIEQAAKRDLFSKADRKKYFVSFNLDGLLRGDFLSRQQGFAVMFQNGVISDDEWRDYEHINPMPGAGGDKHFVPLNMIPLDLAGQTPAAPVASPSPARALRESRSVEMIHRLRSAHLPILEDAARRLLRREADAVERRFTKASQEGSLAEFLAWVESYYSEFRETIAQTMTPALQAIADTVGIEAVSMVGANTMPALDTFVSSYVAALVSRHSSDSRGQIQTLLNAGEPEAILTAANDMLHAWRTGRAGQIARREAVRISNAVSRFVWQSAGVQQLRWQIAKECPDCEPFNGMTIGIRDEFSSQLLHPPLHDDCQCIVLPA